MQWCNRLFHLQANALLCSTYYSETFQRVIRYALKNARTVKSATLTAIVYIAMDFDPNLIVDLTSSLANVKFEHIRNDPLHEDMIDIDQLEEFVQRDLKDAHCYSAMVIANAGRSSSLILFVTISMCFSSCRYGLARTLRRSETD